MSKTEISQNIDSMNEFIPYSGKRYRTFDYEMKKRYGSKVVKLSVDGGFSCPNRKDSGGCIFCTERGSGEFTGDPKNLNSSISKQIEYQKKMLSKKWQTDKFIAYFQNYTNTYAPVDVLKRKYDEALACNVMGLAIATRPDCLDNNVLDLLQSYTCPIWIELGLQSVNCGDKIHRGYDNSVYVEAAHKLKQRNIEFVTHVIFGFPWETKEQMLDTVRFAADNLTDGIKIHMLYIDKTTPLAEYYKNTEFHILSQEEYTDAVCEAIAILPENIVIHRVTGDGKKENLIAPKWTLNKRCVLNGIDKCLAQRNYFQGCKYKENRDKK